MKNIFGFILLLFAISIFGCKKSKMDCEVNNYGIQKITYGLSTYRHIVYATLSGKVDGRIKYAAIGITSDTLHLTPGTYSIFITRLDAYDSQVEQKSSTSTIKQCDESLTSVSF
jgi:hypothetical protein